MRALLPFAVLALAACDPPMQELFPPRFYGIERAGITYDLRAQYDPFVRAWFVRVTSIELPLEKDDLALATALVEQDLSPRLCEQGRLDIDPGEVWNPLAGDRVQFLDGVDAWRFVAECTDAPAVTVVVAPGADPWATLEDPMLAPPPDAVAVPGAAPAPDAVIAVPPGGS